MTLLPFFCILTTISTTTDPQHPVTTKEDRIKGAYFGALVADAMCLGSHYEYDAKIIKKAYDGIISRYMAPGEKMGGTTHGVGWGRQNYHPGQEKGDNTDYGLYNELVLEHLADAGGSFKLDEFVQKHWLPKMKGDNWGARKCTQTKEALQKIQNGSKPAKVGGPSNAMALRTAAIFATSPDEDNLEKINKETMFTHANENALVGGEYFTRVAYKVIKGMAPREAIHVVVREAKNGDASPLMEKNYKFIAEQVKKAIGKYTEASDPQFALSKEEFVDDLAVTSMARLWEVGKTEPIKVGKASPTEGTMPASLYFILKYHDNLIAALQANAMVGGDNAARAIAIGMVLGAYHGVKEIGHPWRTELKAWKRSEKMLDALLAQKSKKKKKKQQDEL